MNGLERLYFTGRRFHLSFLGTISVLGSVPYQTVTESFSIRAGWMKSHRQTNYTLLLICRNISSTAGFTLAIHIRWMCLLIMRLMEHLQLLFSLFLLFFTYLQLILTSNGFYLFCLIVSLWILFDGEILETKLVCHLFWVLKCLIGMVATKGCNPCKYNYFMFFSFKCFNLEAAQPFYKVRVGRVTLKM